MTNYAPDPEMMINLTLGNIRDNIKCKRFSLRSRSGQPVSLDYIVSITASDHGQTNAAAALAALQYYMKAGIVQVWIMDDGAPRDVTRENIANLENVLP